jgi:hypothetical protein
MANTKLGNGESFRRIIMKQENVFKYQVHELHRLYRMQKSLMTELNQPDQTFNSYFDCHQRMEQDKEISSSNYRTSASASGTSRYKQYYDIHSDDESDDINLGLTLGMGIGSRPKRETSINDTKSNSAGAASLYSALS